jgi:hypothetical protein
MSSQLPVPFGLTDRIKSFVDHYVAMGGRSQEKAAVLAGFAPSGAAAHASRLLRRQDVLAYLKHVAETRIMADVAVSVDVLREIRDDRLESPPGERRKAASELLDRAGMIIAKISEHHVTVDDRRMRSPTEMAHMLTKMRRDILAELVEQGLVMITDQSRLDAHFEHQREVMIRIADRQKQQAIDAEFEEVSDEPADDLSDLL